MKDIKKWIKDLSRNSKIAGKYRGVSNLEEIVKMAKKDGYVFSEQDLLKTDLDLAVGGQKNKRFKSRDSFFRLWDI